MKYKFSLLQYYLKYLEKLVIGTATLIDIWYFFFFFFETIQDCEDANPLIRALAVRTMGCIRVDKITEYLCEPLRKCLKDEDPYVRKTAAVCVAKLHDINAQLVEDQGFLDTLKDLISDSNPMVQLN